MNRSAVIGSVVALLFVVGLVVVALSRTGGDQLDGRWQLELIELPTDALRGGPAYWIEFDGDRFSGVGDCVEFGGRLAVPADNRVVIEEFTTTQVCEPLHPVDTAYLDHFEALSVLQGPGGGSVTLQNRGASVQFSYVWAP